MVGIREIALESKSSVIFPIICPVSADPFTRKNFGIL